ncbi:MAG TPA: hemolysin family protein [Longimicrobium sp.]|nr:hemolysin family protein [Longimicrobium sp.]
MSPIAREVLLIVFLVLINGVFSMSEIAVVSSRRSRLQERADNGDAGARRALHLSEEPNRFLATVQVGITLVGVLAGAFGGATLSKTTAAWLAGFPAIAPYSEGLALGLVVLGITYLSLIVGELVPKRIGLNSPERIAAVVAGPMHTLSVVASPLVTLLTLSTEGAMRLLRIRKTDDPPVTEAEIASLLEAGTQAGVFEEDEQDLVEGVFWLADQRVTAVMTPRPAIVWLDAAESAQQRRAEILSHRYSRFVVCDGELDRVLGVMDVRDLWAAGGDVADVRPLLHQPLMVPESTRALQLLDRFRTGGAEVALVVDEYGGIEGLVTLHDLLEAVVGDIHVRGDTTDPDIVQREDGSFLMAGALATDDLREALGLPERRGDERRDYRTLGGFVFTRLGRVPRTGDHFEADGFRYEVVDMDGNRIDRLLVSRLEPED